MAGKTLKGAAPVTTEGAAPTEGATTEDAAPVVTTEGAAPTEDAKTPEDILREAIATFVGHRYGVLTTRVATLRAERMDILETISTLRSSGRNGKGLQVLEGELAMLDSDIANIDGLAAKQSATVDGIFRTVVIRSDPSFSEPAKVPTATGTGTGRRGRAPSGFAGLTRYTASILDVDSGATKEASGIDLQGIGNLVAHIHGPLKDGTDGFRTAFAAQNGGMALDSHLTNWGGEGRSVRVECKKPGCMHVVTITPLPKDPRS